MANLKSQSLQIDNAVDNLMQVAFNVYYNTTADVIANYPDGTFDTENRYNAFSMCEILKDYEKDVPYIKKIYFYFNAIDMFITSAGVYDPGEINTLGFDGLHREKLQEILDQSTACSFVKISDKIYFIYSDTNHLKYMKRLIIEVDFAEILTFQTYKADGLIDGTAVVSPDGTLLGTSGEENLSKILEQANITDGTDEYHVNINDNDYMILVEKSEKNDLTYVYVTVESAFYETVEKSKVLVIISLVICVLLGLSVIYVSLKNNYNPIKNLLKLLNEESDWPYVDENEFDYVNKAISSIIVKKKEFTNRLLAQEPILRRDIIRQILKGNTGNLPVSDILHSLKIDFKHNYFMVVIFYIENKHKLFFDEENDNDPDAKNKELANYAVLNIMEELLPSEKCTMVHYEEDFVLTLILNVKDNNKETEAYIYNKLEEGKTLLEKKCNLFYTVGVSDIHRNIDGIAFGYSEAMRCLEQRFLFKKEETILFKDIKALNVTGYYFPLDIEQKLIYCLKAGEYNKCSEILDHIYKVNVEENYIGLELTKCLMFDILGALVKSISEIYFDTEKISGISKMFEYSNVSFCKES